MNLWNQPSNNCVPSADRHSTARTPRARSLVWSGADGLAVREKKQDRLQLAQMLFKPTGFYSSRRHWTEEREIHKYPRRAADYIGELFDELACAGDDFVGLLLRGVSGGNERDWKTDRQNRERTMRSQTKVTVGRCFESVQYMMPNKKNKHFQNNHDKLFML